MSGSTEEETMTTRTPSSRATAGHDGLVAVAVVLTLTVGASVALGTGG